MKILALSWRDIKAPKSGGAEVHSHELFKCLKMAGYDVVSFTPDYEGGAKSEIIDGITYIRSGGTLSVINEARKYYKKHADEFDYVIDQCNTHRFFTKYWVPAKKRIFYIHQLTREIWDINAKFPVNVIGKITESPMLKMNNKDWAITVSDSTKQELIEQGFDENKIFIVPNGLSEKLFVEYKKYPKDVVPTFIYVGRYVKYKGIDICVEAVGKLREQGIPARLWILGKRDDEYIKSELIPICEKYGMTSSNDMSENSDITFCGFISDEDKLELQGRAHALLFPSIREGWGIIVSEAACMGTPSIVFDSPGCRDAVNKGKSGYLCKDNSVDGLVEQMLLSINDTELYEKMQQAAFDYTTQFTWEKNQTIVKNMMETIELAKTKK